MAAIESGGSRGKPDRTESPSDRNRTAYTIGHSNRPLTDLVDALHAWRISTLLDVRKMPRSRLHPQFDAAPLPTALAPEGIAYAHLPAMGGLRPKAKRSEND